MKLVSSHSLQYIIQFGPLLRVHWLMQLPVTVNWWMALNYLFLVPVYTWLWRERKRERERERDFVHWLLFITKSSLSLSLFRQKAPWEAWKDPSLMPWNNLLRSNWSLMFFTTHVTCDGWPFFNLNHVIPCRHLCFTSFSPSLSLFLLFRLLPPSSFSVQPPVNLVYCIRTVYFFTSTCLHHLTYKMKRRRKKS